MIRELVLTLLFFIMVCLSWICFKQNYLYKGTAFGLLALYYLYLMYGTLGL